MISKFYFLFELTVDLGENCLKVTNFLFCFVFRFLACFFGINMNVVVRGGKNILDRTGGMAPKPEDIPEDIHVLNVTSTRLRGCLFDLPQLKMLEVGWL